MLEENLEWNLHLNLLKSKLNRAISLICKIRHYGPKFLLKTLAYYTIFHSHLIYASDIREIFTKKIKYSKFQITLKC